MVKTVKKKKKNAESGRTREKAPDSAQVWRMEGLTRDVTTEPVSGDQILGHKRGQGNVNFPYSADHEQDWQPCPVDRTLLKVLTMHSYPVDDHTHTNTHTYTHTETNEKSQQSSPTLYCWHYAITTGEPNQMSSRGFTKI